MRAVVPVLLILAACSGRSEEARARQDGPRSRSSATDEAPSPWQGIYGHSPSTLFRIDPDTYEVTTVGKFEGCRDVLDIAVDSSDRIVGATGIGLYAIDPNTAKCTLITRGSFPNSLSFLPAGTVDANEEALVGYEADRYIRIDAETGAITQLGWLAASDLRSSGDIVSVRGGKTFLTVKGVGCETDCLVEVDPVTGAMKKNWGALGYRSVYGIAFWAGHVYGFSDGGNLFEVTFEGDRATPRQLKPPAAMAFWGAGSTTIAPLRSTDDGPAPILRGDAPSKTATMQPKGARERTLGPSRISDPRISDPPDSTAP